MVKIGRAGARALVCLTSSTLLLSGCGYELPGPPADPPAPLPSATSSPSSSPSATAPSQDNPFAGASFAPQGPDSAVGRAAAGEGDPRSAAALRAIADRPAADWFGDWNPTASVRTTVDARTGALTAAGHLPVYVVYNVPERDGGGYSSGGAPDLPAYRAWIDEVAAGLGGRRAAVLVEPDAVAFAVGLTGDQRAERLAALNYAVDALSAAGAEVYLDAGNASWHPPSAIAPVLREAGLDRARGFALNVSGFDLTADTVSYGEQIAALAGGKPFVIDTSRNGNGPYPEGPEPWCNPPGRALGPAPAGAPDPAHPLVDAYYYVKTPGESDGTCRGFPPAGTFVPSYAIELALNAGL